MKERDLRKWNSPAKNVKKLKSDLESKSPFPREREREREGERDLYIKKERKNEEIGLAGGGNDNRK